MAHSAIRMIEPQWNCRACLSGDRLTSTAWVSMKAGGSSSVRRMM